MRVVLLTALALSLGACATPKVQGANELGGVIRYGNRYSGDEAFAQAEAHCARYNRIARVSHQDVGFVWTMYFDCVERPPPAT